MQTSGTLASQRAADTSNQPGAETLAAGDHDARSISETLSILTWPPGVSVESPAFEHFLASVVAPFCARYPTPSTQLLYRRSLTYFFRWWGQARETGRRGGRI